MLPLSVVSNNNFVMPPGASTYSPDVDWLMWFNLWMCVAFTLLIFVGTGYLAVRYRHKKGVNDMGRGPTHSNLLEIVWSVIPLIIVLLIAIWGFQGYMAIAVLPPANDGDTLEIAVNAYKWGWEFQYPNGHSEPALHVPVHTKVRLIESSRDVIHSLYLPEFRYKKDAVPGRFNKGWFEATEPSPLREGLNPSDPASYDPDTGDKDAGFDIFCTEYCGTGHSRMLSRVYVHPDYASYAKWLETASNVYNAVGGHEPAAKDVGLKLIKGNGCFSCHSIDGSKGTGPTWKDMVGNPVSFADGSNLAAVDEDYIRESILYPQKKIVQGFGGAMPSYLGKFSDRDLAAIISYMKSISSGYHGSPSALEAPVPKANEDKLKTK